MLLLNGDVFASGRCKYFDSAPGRNEVTAKVYLEIVLQDVEYPVLAQLDTGAAYSMLDREVADAANLFGVAGELTKIRSRDGVYRGALVKVPTKLVAELGESLELEGTFFISEDWPFGSFIGYSGFLDSIRSALDPGTNHFFFGALGGR